MFPPLIHTLAALDAACNPHPWTHAQWASGLVAGNWGAVVCVIENGYQIKNLIDFNDLENMPHAVGYYLALSAADEAHLLTIGVAVAQRRLGLGARLMAHFEQAARERGAASLWLEVRESNAAARALYAAQGWTWRGRRRDYYPCPEGGQREAAYIFSKP